MNPQAESRQALVLSIERTALVCRYLVYIILAPLFAASTQDFGSATFIAITVLLFGHNAFAHWVFYARAYRYFASRVNFIVYLVEATAIVELTGAEHSPGYILFLLVIIGYGCYAGELKSTLQAAGLCAAALAGIVGIEWLRGSLDATAPHLVALFVGLGVCGWLMGSLGARLRDLESRAIGMAQEAASSEATLRTILDNAADPIFVYDESERIIEANNPACKLLGEPRETLLGKRVRTFIFDDGTLGQKMASLRATGEARGREVFVDREGTERTVDMVVRSVIREGRHYNVVIGHDITDQVNLQEAARLANLHLERLNKELRQLDQLKTDFLVTMSQRLRSPMAALLGYVEMLLDEELGEIRPEQRKALRTCRRSAYRVLRLLDEALELGGRTSPGLAPTDSAVSPPPARKP